MLQGKVIIVTGGGSGIGEASCKVLAGHGATVIVGDVDVAGAERVAATINKNGGKSVATKLDVTVEKDSQAVVELALSTYGALHGAFNNAGIGCPEALPHETSEEWFRKTMEIDLFGVWYSLKHQVKAMIDAGQGGSIVINASDAGKNGSRLIAPYNAAKAAAINLMRTAAIDYGDHNIRFNAVCPGPIKTPAMAERLAAMGTDESYYLGGLALRRMGRPEEVGELAAFLLSDRASYITGEAISVDGGFAASYV